MIGLDRPLKPVWIYRMLQQMQPGVPLSAYNTVFAELTPELIGAEGTRKVRTVIFRSFVLSLQDSKKVVEPNPFLQAVQQHPIAYMQPLFFAKLLMDYPAARDMAAVIHNTRNADGCFAADALRKKMVRLHGDRDVVKRSVRAFIATLRHFNLARPGGEGRYQLLPAPSLTAEQHRDLLLLYARHHLHATTIELSSLDMTPWQFFQPPNLQSLARTFQHQSWEYIRDMGRDVLILG